MDIDLEPTLDDLKKEVKVVPDFPEKGVNFIDWLPWFNDSSCIQGLEDVIRYGASKKCYQILTCDYFMVPEARGFLLAPLLSRVYQKPVYFLRKKGKLPDPGPSVTYMKEYGPETLVAQNGLPSGNYVFVDDVFATGGTFKAASELVEKNGGNMVGSFYLFVVDAIPHTTLPPHVFKASEL